VQIDLSHAGQRPALCDGRFRHIVTIDDALRLGCNLFDLAELLDEYPDDEFANLFRASSSTTAIRSSRCR
jgi:aryl-alcohol dehydrogenase-like predicted oxidoreductase